MGIARASGENRAVEAAHQAIASPLLELDIHGAQGILWNITGSSNLSLYEVNEAAEAIKEAADPEAMIMFGTSFNERLADEVMITVIATGFDGGRKRPSIQREAAGVMDAASVRISHERDFLQELERQREQTESPYTTHEDEPAAVVSSPRVERTVGEATPSRRQVTYDADDLEIPSFLRRK
jgi:cell division protein FtsZ